MSPRQRILIYRDFLLPRSETFIQNQAEGLQRFEPYYAGLTEVDGIQLPSERVVTVRRGRFGPLQSAMFTRVGLTPDFAWRVWRLNPRLIHAHFGVDGTRVMRLASALGLPLLVTLHDYDVTTSDADLMKLAPYCRRYIARRPELTRRASAFIAVSEFIKAKAISRGFPEEKILVHYIGIDTGRFQPDLDVPRDPVVLFVGRLVEKKGLKYLLSAMARVQARHPSTQLVVIGDGPLRRELEAQAAAELTHCRFLGALSSEQVQQWYARARIFCAPSVTAKSGETEGLPITVLEAQAMALPVVSTRHSGIPEAVSHGETGWLADERDAGGLAEAIATLLSEPARARALGEAARRSVRERFDMQTQVARLEEIYDHLVSRKPLAQSGIFSG